MINLKTAQVHYLGTNPEELHQPFDIYAIGRSYPISPSHICEAARFQTGEAYTIVQVRGGNIFAIVVRESLLQYFSPEQLAQAVSKHGQDFSSRSVLVGIRMKTYSDLSVVREDEALYAETPPPQPATVGSLAGKDVVTATPRDTVALAAQQMVEHGIGCLPVVDENGLVGIVTSRDLRGVHPDWCVKDVMQQKLVAVEADCRPLAAYQKMEENNIERLVILHEGRLAGVVTKKDLLLHLGRQIDHLTGLKTAPCLREKAEELLEQGREISIIFIDLNDFGLVNKKYGHVTGDRTLQSIAGAIAAAVEEGPEEMVCRYGGDEFTVLTTRPADEAEKLAASIARAVAEAKHPGSVTVTTAIGIAGGRRQSYRPGTHAAAVVDDLINLASRASSMAKEQGVPVLRHPGSR